MNCNIVLKVDNPDSVQYSSDEHKYSRSVGLPRARRIEPLERTMTFVIHPDLSRYSIK